MHIEHATAFLYALKPKGIRFGLENTKLVLRNLGVPQARFQSIHLAGSNGKGSTAAFLDAMLRRAGFKVGLYTSPHLVHFRERFQINGKPVEDGCIEAAMDRFLEKGLELDARELQRWIEQGDMIAKMSSGSWYHQRGSASQFCSLTFFECTTVLAMMLFAEHGVDLAVMECGMGGRLDATNVLSPLVSVITPIHLEHTRWLGDTIQAIAGEKAGIIKAGVPVVCGRQADEALEVIRNQAALQKAPLYVMGKDFDGWGDWHQADFRIHEHRIGPVSLGLMGNHQVENAACALACLPVLNELGWHVEDSAVCEGLSQVVWPGRFERFGNRGEWILDCAHNPDGVLVLVKTLEQVLRGKKVRLVFGVLEDKRVDNMLPLLVSWASFIHLVKPKDARGKDPAAVAALLDVPALTHPSVASALDALIAEDGPPVLVTGSLTVVGESREWLLKKGISPSIFEA